MLCYQLFMKNIYRHTETVFEKLTAIVTTILGNSVAFVIALVLVVFWLTHDRRSPMDLNVYIGDIIHGTIFLTLFIIQKGFNRFEKSIHLKVNELVASNELARNAVINVEEKTEHEMTELSKQYTELAEQAHEEEVKAAEKPPIIVEVWPI